jgi:hypothetical protein
MTYMPRTQPRAHQAEALQRIAQKPASPSSEDVFALLMDMGTGKTKVVVDEWGARTEAGDLSDLLVIAPAGSYRNWYTDRGDDEPSELRKHLDPALFERVVTTGWVSGAGVLHRRSLDAIIRSRDPARPRALFVNIEALSTVKAAKDACLEFMRTSQRGTLLAVDESTSIRTPGIERVKSVLQLAEKARVRRIMTGLPTPKSPMDLYTQFEFLDWRILGFNSFYAFRARHALLRKMKFGARSFWVEVSYRDLPVIQEKIAPYSYRVLKEDCLDLEPKVWTTRDVSLSPDQERIYREMRQYATAQLGEESWVTATSVITQILRLHQVLCGHTTDEEGRYHEVPEQRTRALLELLTEHRGKAIIWATYDPTIRKIAAALAKEFGEESVACFWGGNRSTRDKDETRFKTDPKCRFMVSTQAAGGMGNTWVVADLVVYYANNYDLEQRQQSEDRAHRDGQTRRVTYVDLVARGTVDEKIIQALRRKIDMATAITGENYREWLV